MYFIVTDTDDKGYVYIVDGDIRKVEKPKKKKIRHIEITEYYSEVIAEKAITKSKMTNQDVKKALKEIIKAG